MTSRLSSGFLFLPFGLCLLMLSACSESESQYPAVGLQLDIVPGDTISVVGILIDTSCYSSNHANMGMDHPDPIPTSQSGPACARYCALQGMPVGLLTDGKDSPAWMLLSNPQVLSDYMGNTVRVRGVVRSQGVLTPERVEMKTADGGWTFVL